MGMENSPLLSGDEVVGQLRRRGERTRVTGATLGNFGRGDETETAVSECVWLARDSQGLPLSLQHPAIRDARHLTPPGFVRPFVLPCDTWPHTPLHPTLSPGAWLCPQCIVPRF